MIAKAGNYGQHVAGVREIMRMSWTVAARRAIGGMIAGCCARWIRPRYRVPILHDGMWNAIDNEFTRASTRLAHLNSFNDWSAHFCVS
jgi:hypothetical protein